jgi:hypothetical protein
VHTAVRSEIAREKKERKKHAEHKWVNDVQDIS